MSIDTSKVSNLIGVDICERAIGATIDIHKMSSLIDKHLFDMFRSVVTGNRKTK